VNCLLGCIFTWSGSSSYVNVLFLPCIYYSYCAFIIIAMHLLFSLCILECNTEHVLLVVFHRAKYAKIILY
jgi:hypothetical protein